MADAEARSKERGARSKKQEGGSLPEADGSGREAGPRHDDSGCGEDVSAAQWTGSFVYHPARILLVDDARNQCRSMACAFEAAGFEPLAAWTSDDARRLVDRQPFDCAVIDWQLTGWWRDGIGLAAELKEPWPRTPVVLVSHFVEQYVKSSSKLELTEVDVFCPKDPFAAVLQTVAQFARDYRDTIVWAGVEEVLARLDAPARKLDDRVRNVISRVCVDLTGAWDMPELCEAAGRVQPRDLGRAFGSSLGVRPKHFVKMVRVATAKPMVARGDLKQEAIAARVGFRNKQRLYDAFRDIEKLPPGAFAPGRGDSQ